MPSRPALSVRGPESLPPLFHPTLCTQIKKVNDFTVQLVENWRRDLKKLSVAVHGKNREKEDDEALIEVWSTSCKLSMQATCKICLSAVGHLMVICWLQEARRIGGEFLSLEKYANLNYMVRRILLGMSLVLCGTRINAMDLSQRAINTITILGQSMLTCRASTRSSRSMTRWCQPLLASSTI